MAIGKNSINNLENRRDTYLKIGYVVTLSLLLAAFEWRSPVRQIDTDTLWQDVDTFMGDIPNTFTPPEQKPEPLRANPPVLQYPTTFNPVIDTEPETSPAPTNDPEPAPNPEPLVGPPDTVLAPDWLPFPQFEASFPGGENALHEYLGNNIHYTPPAREDKVDGKVYISFTIMKDGSIDSVKLIRGLGYGLDEIALGAVRNMPKWSPAQQGIHKVCSPFILPVHFTLKKN